MSLKLSPLILGDLPTFQLAEFGLVLPDGVVRLSIATQQHAIKRHGNDYWRCHPYLEEVIETPSAVGRSPHHPEACELIKEIHDASINVLVAVRIAPAGDGIYQVSSIYPIDTATIERRIRRGFLKFV